MIEKTVTRLHQAVLKHPDRLSGLVVMLIAVIAIIEAMPLPFGSLRAPGAGFFPQSLSVLLLIFGGGIVLRSLGGSAERIGFDSRSWLVGAAAVGFIAYALILPFAGFVLATIGIMLLVMRGLSGMPWRQALLIAVLSVVISYIGFSELGVPLPRGPLPF